MSGGEINVPFCLIGSQIISIFQESKNLPSVFGYWLSNYQHCTIESDWVCNMLHCSTDFWDTTFQGKNTYVNYHYINIWPACTWLRECCHHDSVPLCGILYGYVRFVGLLAVLVVLLSVFKVLIEHKLAGYLIYHLHLNLLKLIPANNSSLKVINS